MIFPNNHRKFLKLLSLILLQVNTLFLSYSQEYGNEWIVQGQTYYKIPVGKTGLYAISLNQLRGLGISVAPSGTIQQSELQLFHRGKEQAITISNDTLFFYGKMNDGTLDSLLYDPYNKQPHKYYNLYSDTSAYFLTWASGQNGKRMLTNSLASVPDNGTYHFEEVLHVATDEYKDGARYSAETFMSYGDQGEGWFSSDINNTSSGYAFSFQPVGVYTGGPSANLEVMLVGVNENPSHNHTVKISSAGNPDLVFTVPTFSFHQVVTYKVQIPFNYLTNGTCNILVSNTGSGDPNNTSYSAVGYIKVTYPQLLTMNNGLEHYFNVPASNVPLNLSISNPSTNVRLFDITDENNIKIINYNVQGGTLTTTIPASLSTTNLYAVSYAALSAVPAIIPVSLSSYSNVTTAGFIIISNTKLMSGAREFARYRASVAGGAHDTLLAEINKLYNLFSYGEKSPIAIRRFMSYLTSVGNPEYLFIIGKGLIIDYNRNGPYYRKNPAFYYNNKDVTIMREDLVPTFGKPGSDLLFTSGLLGKPHYVPAIKTGRFPAVLNSDVIDYLNKVKEHEGLGNTIWRKNLLHLSGGHTNYEKNLFLSHVNNLKLIAEDTIFGGKVVNTISKNGSDAVDNELIGNVADVINSGVSLVTFFGHSSSFVIDLDIGFASQDFYGYHNKAKYPMLFMNGCGSSQMYVYYSFAEDWVKTPDRGAILTLGHTDVGYVDELQNYSTYFYRNAFNKRAYIGKSVGDLHLATINDFNVYHGSTPTGIATIHQMVIQGDPSLKIYRPEKPDFEVEDNGLSLISLDDKIITAVSDSFAIKIIASNLGLNLGDSLKISIKRTVSGKDPILYGPYIFNPLNYQDTLLFVIKSADVSFYGENIFEVQLDPYNEVDEISEVNNKATLLYFIPLSGVTALFPREFSIVNSSPVTFVAQSTNLLIDPTDYYIELDTSYLFNSPVKKSTVVNSGSLIKWSDVDLNVLTDSTVYYWRVRYNNIGVGEDTLWGTSSFIYIKDSPEGWSQSKFPQFFKDQLVNTDQNTSLNKWEFTKNVTPISIQTVGSNYDYLPDYPYIRNPSMETIIKFFNNAYLSPGYNFSIINALYAVAFDRVTGMPYTPYPASQGGKTAGVPSKDILNVFDGMYDNSGTPGTSLQNQANFMEFLDRVPADDYVLLVTSGDVYYDHWSSSLINKIQTDLGADSLSHLVNGTPYILFTQKGNPNPIYENWAVNNTVNKLLFNYTLTGINKSGSVTSTVIGPATNWGTFYHNYKPSEVPVTDSLVYKIIGVDITGKSVDTISISQKDSLDLSTIPALKNYPYIRLLAQVQDTTNLTPPQLTRWQVIYGGVPEGTMNPDKFGKAAYAAVTKQEGDSLKVCFAFENISNYDFDTLTVKYSITNANQGVKTNYVKLTPLKKDSLITFCQSFSTKGLQGNNILQAYVNPEILKEQYYTNNVLEIPFTVISDKTHPILDVAFDGVHIMDGDLVSPSPMIAITLNDENKFLIRDNSDGMEVYIQYPGQSVPVKVDPSNYAGKQIGVNGKNVYQIEYNPKNLADGKYILIVRAKDVAGNTSGVEDYRINFEVKNEATITNFYPYPNPFSSSTRFVFTITGSELPQDLKIEIMTVTGKVVREITMAEIGTLRIGNNKTDYAWDGTDEFGDKLANGVYLYRVIIKNASAFHHMNTAGDKAFKKDFGKIYILR